ncbi:MAG TPA: SLBB domain-containing protein [Verrucomicrobiae bacterium]|nr:SLBB domain-containing protein [Verrucomicrobiae bacterium]
MKYDELVRQIKKAFKDGPAPSEDNIVCHECEECFALRDDVRGHTPDELSDSWVEQNFEKPKHCGRRSPNYGQVQNPGRYGWLKGMTVIDAVAAVGGLKQFARHRIQIIRDDSRFIFAADTIPYGVKNPPVLRQRILFLCRGNSLP